MSSCQLSFKQPSILYYTINRIQTTNISSDFNYLTKVNKTVLTISFAKILFMSSCQHLLIQQFCLLVLSLLQESRSLKQQSTERHSLYIPNYFYSNLFLF